MANGAMPTNLGMTYASNLLGNIHTGFLTKDRAPNKGHLSSWGYIMIH